ncbi:MAG: phosphosulfolactate synthase [Bacteroidetes bacterium]|nr:phosphosulfolactate synthase [Bacteroidota bacterium]
MENIHLPLMPERTKKPRTNGVAMVMDKGLSIREAEDFISVSADFTDFVKLGFGTSVVTPNVKEKIRLYQQANMKVYVGGTLFEAFLIRNMMDEYRRYIDDLGIDAVEISDGSMRIDHAKKCEFITTLAKNYLVLSEVGAKEAGILIAPARWIEMMETELAAGAFMVIAEARESGTCGIYRPNGKAHTVLINRILSRIPLEKILWEAPLKSQQAWFIEHFGTNVNLGNIAPNEIIPLETLRLGLRGDTFFRFLPDEYKKYKLE